MFRKGVIKKPFIEAAGYVREAKKFICLAVAVFLAGVMLGVLFPERFEALLASFKTMAERFQGRSAATTIVMIFLKNFSSAFISILLGVFFGIVPMIAALTNGVLVGAVISYGTQLKTIRLLWMLLPHGVFELPAIFISWGLGIQLGAWPFKRDKVERFSGRLRKSFQVLITFVVPLLIIAAIIEGLSISMKH